MASRCTFPPLLLPFVRRGIKKKGSTCFSSLSSPRPSPPLPPSSLATLFFRFYDKIQSVTGLAVAELKHLEHHMLQVR